MALVQEQYVNEKLYDLIQQHRYDKDASKISSLEREGREYIVDWIQNEDNIWEVCITWTVLKNEQRTRCLHE